jgi:Tol biopolymer transport system component
VDVNMRTEIVRAPFDPSRRALAAAPVPVFSGSFELREQQLSPAGDWIVFTNEDPPQQLHLVRPDGTGYRQLTTDSDRHRQAEFSPDGAWIVFQTTRGGAGLAAIRTDGGGWQR